MSGWIAVSERLPSVLDGHALLAHCSNGFIVTAEYSFVKGWLYYPYPVDEPIVPEVTHWHELPDFPEQP